MNSETRYVSAPFVREIAFRGRPYFVREDQRRRLVAATAATRHVLARMAAGATAAETASGWVGGAAGEIERAVDALAGAALLVPLDDVRLEPPSIELEITNRCNADCVMCPRKDLRALGTMDETTFSRVLAILGAIPARGVIVQGIGEPTLDRDLVRRMERVRGVMPRQPLAVVTNGFRMTPALLSSLRSAGVDHVQWSFHSLRRGTYDAIMGTPAYDVALGNLEACAAEHADVLSLNVVVMDRNRADVDELRAWARAHGLPDDAVRLIPCMSRGGRVDVDALASGGSRAARGRCVYVKKSIFIAWNGDLLPCSSDIAGEAVWQNVRELESSSLLAEWRDRILAPPPAFPMCARCDHFLRDTLDSAWFDAIHGASIAEVGE